MEINPESNSDQQKINNINLFSATDREGTGSDSPSRNMRFLPETFFEQIYTSQSHREQFISALAALPPFYLITGDVDDAMLTLSSVLDSGKPFHVLLCTRTIETCLSFLYTHRQIQSIIVAPTPTSAKDLQAMVAVCKSLPSCCGMGLKAFETELVQIFSDFERERVSVVDVAPLWARSLRNVSNKRSRIIIHTHGVCAPVIRSERPIIDPRSWDSMNALIARYDAEVVLTGDASLTEVYPAREGMIDMRSATIDEQRACIRSASLFVSSDCPELVIAAMMGLSCVHCLPLRGYDIEGLKNNRLRFTYTRFSNIRSVESSAQFGVAIAEEARLNDIQLRHTTKASTINDSDRSTVPERRLGNSILTSFHPVFWNRSYASAKNVLIKSSAAVGDSLMICGVAHALKQQYPHLLITVAGPPHILDLYRTHPDVSNFVVSGSAEELLYERDADEVVDYNFIGDRFPEYYHGIHLNDILANIAGVLLPSRNICYQSTDQEIDRVRRVLDGAWSGVKDRLIIGVHFSTNKGTQRSYPHASALVSALLDQYQSLCIVNAGTDTLKLSHDRLLECSTVPEWGLREHIAVMSFCQKAIVIDSSFLHVAHNLWSKPTLLLQTVSRLELIVNTQINTVVPVRNTAHGCRACYFLKPTCKQDCMSAFDVPSLMPLVTEFLENRMHPAEIQFANTAETVQTTYDANASSIARLFAENSKSMKLINVVVKCTTETPEYVKNWNGVQVIT